MSVPPTPPTALALDFGPEEIAAESGELGGQLYGAGRLAKLEGYLGRRGVTLDVSTVEYGGKFVACQDGSATLFLKADPTNVMSPFIF